MTTSMLAQDGLFTPAVVFIVSSIQNKVNQILFEQIYLLWPPSHQFKAHRQYGIGISSSFVTLPGQIVNIRMIFCRR